MAEENSPEEGEAPRTPGIRHWRLKIRLKRWWIKFSRFCSNLCPKLGPRGARTVSIVRGALYLTLMALFIEILMPFGFDEQIEHHSEKIFLRLAASYYHPKPTDERQFADTYVTWEGLGAEGEGNSLAYPQDRIRLIYVSEKVITDIREETAMGWQGWRPDYHDLAEVMRNISTFCIKDVSEEKEDRSCPEYGHPQSVFFDAIFLDKGAKWNDGDTVRYLGFEEFTDAIKEITNYEEWSKRFPPEECETPFERLICIQRVGGVPVILALPVEHPASILVPCNENGPLGLPEGATRFLVEPCEEVEDFGFYARIWEHKGVVPAQQAFADFAIGVPPRLVGEEGGYPLIVTVRPLDSKSQQSEDDSEGSKKRRIVAEAPCNWGTRPEMDGAGETARFSCVSSTLTSASLLYVSACLSRPEECAPIDIGRGKMVRWATLKNSVIQTSHYAPVRRLRRSLAATFERDMVVTWGARVPDHYVDVKRGFQGETPKTMKWTWPWEFNGDMAPAESRQLECYIEKRSLLFAAKRFVRLLFFNLGEDAIQRSYQECLYHLEIPYSGLNYNKITPARTKVLLNDRVVIFGGRYENSSDIIESPVHGNIPGMHLHAMALDNLMTKGGRYLAVPRTVYDRWFQFDLLDLWDVVFVLLSAAFAIRLRIYTEDSMGAVSYPQLLLRWRLFFILISMACLFVFWSLSLTVLGLRSAPADWMGLSGILLAMWVYIDRSWLKAWLQDSGPTFRKPYRPMQTVLELIFFGLMGIVFVGFTISAFLLSMSSVCLPLYALMALITIGIVIWIYFWTP